MLEPGIPVFCIDSECFCFRCTAEALSISLANIDNFTTVGSGVGSQSAILTQHTLRIVRYSPCDWSAIVPVFLEETRRLNDMDITRVVSHISQIDALFLGIYDTAGGAAYRFIQSGQLVEQYTYSVEDNECESHSTWRTLNPKKLGYAQVDQIVRELQIIPPLFSSPFEEVGQPIKAQRDIDPVWEQIEEFIILDRVRA